MKTRTSPADVALLLLSEPELITLGATLSIHGKPKPDAEPTAEEMPQAPAFGVGS